MSSSPLVMRYSCRSEPAESVHGSAILLVTVNQSWGETPAWYSVASVTASIVSLVGSHSTPAVLSASDAPALALGSGFASALGEPEGFGVGAGVPPPGRTMMSTTTRITASRPNPTTRRRRQYTLAGWGPTGFFNVDMTQG